MRPNHKPALPALAAIAARPRLFREILIALLVKTALLFGLWWAFFSQAPSKGAIAHDIAGHLAGPGSRAAPAITDSFPVKEPQP
ncbi:MAG: cytochrome oxidase putative small subunit CydP [Hydrogenophilaceae bacterium]